MAKNNKKRQTLSIEEKNLRALHGLFILHAAELGISVGEIRKILGVAMNEVTPIFKAANKAIRKKSKKTSD